MSLSLALFLERFPEFSEARAPETLVLAKIAEASRRVSAEVWGDLHSDGVAYLTAHLLARSPWGQGVRLVADDGSTAYDAPYRDLLRTVVSGVSVI